MNLNLLVVLFIVIGCAHSPKEREGLKSSAAPEWIYSATSSCPNSELCAVGNGKTLNQADARAKASLASIFKLNIKDKLRVSTSSFTKAEVRELEESVSQELVERVQEVLKGVVIKKRFDSESEFYSLAMLDKQKGSEVLRSEIKNYDDKLNYYLKLSNKTYLKKMNKLFNLRTGLNEKLNILSGNGIVSAVTFSQIDRLKYHSKGGDRIKIIREKEVPVILERKFEEYLNEVGYKIVKTGKHDFIINLSFSEKEDYLNVEGFKRYSFLLNVVTKKPSGKKVGGYIQKHTTSGRSQRDAFSKASPKMVESIENNLTKLNLK